MSTFDRIELFVAPEPAPTPAGDPPPDFSDFDHYTDEDCWNCGGEGVTYDCVDGMCVDADSGCDLCSRRCHVCNPPKKPEKVDG